MMVKPSQWGIKIHWLRPPLLPYKDCIISLKQNHIAIFVITGDKQPNRQFAIKKLQRVGYDGWTKLIMKPSNYAEKSAVPYKSSERKKIVNAGYDIVFSIGDQYSDLLGGYADHTYKLPNPFYFVP